MARTVRRGSVSANHLSGILGAELCISRTAKVLGRAAIEIIPTGLKFSFRVFYLFINQKFEVYRNAPRRNYEA